MHSYLRAVGFSTISKRNEMTKIIRDVVHHYDEKHVVEDYEDGTFVEYSKFYVPDAGISVCGVFDEKKIFHPEYSFPFFKGTGITSREPVVIERHAEKESFAGACDDLRIGVTLIFYLQNIAEYMVESKKNPFLENASIPLTLSGLSREGSILLPLMKDRETVMVEKEMTKNRNNLIAAARNGDEEAMESLTMEDMDTYSMISQRIATDDVFTIVDSYFMPYGIECDQYNVMGEILDYSINKNTLTGEEIVQLSLESNDVQYDVCINRNDLLGEPKVGRRFKGIIWLQGCMHFEK